MFNKIIQTRGIQLKTEINTDVRFNQATYGTLWCALWCALLLLLLVGCSVTSQNKVLDKPDLTSPDGQESSMSESFPLAPISQPLDKPLGSSKGTPKELGAVWEAWALLNRDHLDKASFNAEQFEEFAIKGLVAAVEDPTLPMWSQRFCQLNGRIYLGSLRV